MLFNKSNWIWISDNAEADEYGEFFAAFSVAGNEDTICRISCDGDYTLFVNGKYAASNQYGDYEHYKIYDQLDISNLTSEGYNTLSVIVWHFGKNSSRYKIGKAGVIFEVLNGDAVVCASSCSTAARLSKTYESHRCGIITSQLGFGFHYDARGEDGSLFTGKDFANATVVDKPCEFYPRPSKKLCLEKPKTPAKITAENSKSYFLIDLGEETVGLLSLKFKSESEQKIRVDWGEHLDEGHVRRIIAARTFSVEYTAKEGYNDYTNYMLRFGCRYLEVWAESPITLEYAGLIPQYYPVESKAAHLENPLDQRIYDLCVNTLKLSMMEHYVDCPWREQALYAFDSRNQMLSGYYAFENGNADYARSNLKLISMDRRFNGLLSICYPTGKSKAIPSFSLHFFKAVLEYYEHTKDVNFLRDIYPKLLSVIQPFLENIKDGLVYAFSGNEHWNFYDWSDHLDGTVGRGGIGECDSVINLLFIIAVDNLEKIAKVTGEPFTLNGVADKIRENVRSVFLNTKDRLISFKAGNKDYTELANSLAIIAGVADKPLAEEICNSIIHKKVSESSLSLKCFTYDALILTNEEKYKQYILDDIRAKYGYMLDSGATAAWETLKGCDDFGGAGSLCHGWSAIPVYYYHKLGMII